MNTTENSNVVTSTELPLKHIVKGKSFPDEENIRKSSGGKNAYEIRESILEKAINIIKVSGFTDNTDRTVDKVLQVASKLYEFVENKRK